MIGIMIYGFIFKRVEKWKVLSNVEELVSDDQFLFLKLKMKSAGIDSS